MKRIVIVLALLVMLAACTPQQSKEKSIGENYICPLDFNEISETLYLKEDVSDEEIQDYGDAYCQLDLTATLAREGFANTNELVEAQDTFLESYAQITAHTSQYRVYNKAADQAVLSLWLSALVVAQQTPNQITLVKTDSHCDGDDMTPPCILWREYEYKASNSRIFISTLERTDGTYMGVWVIQSFDNYEVARNCDTSVINNPEGIYGCQISYTHLYFENGHYVTLTETGLVMYDGFR